jgi:hypothetical protein
MCQVRQRYLYFIHVVEVSDMRSFRAVFYSRAWPRSNDYSENASSCNSQLKAILVNNVVVGKGYKMLQDDASLTAPPSGYDSVCLYLFPIIFR